MAAAKSNKAAPNIFVFDIETGGFFSDETAGFAEIAIVVLCGTTLEELERYETVIKPYMLPSGELSQYSAGALAVNGLTMDIINSGVEFKVFVKEFKALAKKYKMSRQKPILAGHNIYAFDIPFVERAFDQNGLKGKEILDELFNETKIDTLTYAYIMWPTKDSILNRKLPTVGSKLGVELVNAHRAMPDTVTNASIVRIMLERIKGIGLSSGDDSMLEEDISFKF